MFKTAECVSPRHPDKMCDRISDAILDWYLKQDPQARVAVETMGGHGRVYIIGEVTSKATPIYKTAVEGIVRDITGEENQVEFYIDSQSPEIAQGVDTGGAGDQGIMVGYACRENEELIPQELYLARSLCKFIYKHYQYDGKTQVTIDENGLIKTIVASFCKVDANELSDLIYRWLENNNRERTDQEPIKIYSNPAGDWSLGGFSADTGLTGRKLAVDNYGTRIPLGGGAFSGKDSTKVDRSGAYMARRLAVDILRAHDEYKDVKVEIAYSIGIAELVMAVYTATKGETKIEKQIDIDYMKERLTPAGIIEYLNLTEPKFENTAEWGHFGNGFEWDK